MSSTQLPVPNILNLFGQFLLKRNLYQFRCLDCLLRYVRQLGQTLHTRYTQHIQAICSKKSNSGYINNILNTGHTYRTIDITETKNKENIWTTKSYITSIWLGRTISTWRILTQTQNQILDTLHQLGSAR
jgi:hypothetical protein